MYATLRHGLQVLILERVYGSRPSVLMFLFLLAEQNGKECCSDRFSFGFFFVKRNFISLFVEPDNSRHFPKMSAGK
jgi:hypothetical protein